MLWRVCKGYTILSYAEVDENLADLDTVSSFRTLPLSSVGWRVSREENHTLVAKPITGALGVFFLIFFLG